MLLETLTMKELLVLHNKIADKPLGLKSFATKDKLINRIKLITKANRLDLDSVVHSTSTSVTEQSNQLQVKTTETHNKTRDKGIGELAKQLLLNEQGYSYKVIVKMINQQIPEAKTSVNSIRWYACKLRKARTDISRDKKLPL